MEVQVALSTAAFEGESMNALEVHKYEPCISSNFGDSAQSACSALVWDMAATEGTI